MSSLTRSLGLAAALSLAATAASAQEAPDTVQLDELVVTATRLPISRSASAAAVTVISGQELRERGVAFVGEALRSVPGAALVQTGPTGSLSSLFLRGGEADYVQVLVDGVPVNEPGGRVDFSTLSTDNVERIEVVRGPASVLYGSDAVTGVVQIFTRKGAPSTPRVSASVRGGSYGTLDWGASLAGGSARASYSLGVSRYATDGILEYNNQFDNRVVSGSGRFEAGPRTDATVSVRYSEGEYHYPTDGAGAVVDRNAFQNTDRLVVGLDAGHRIGERFELRALLATSALDGAIDDRADGPADTLGMYGYASDQELRRASADLRGNFFVADGLVLTTGVEIEKQREESSSESMSQWGPSTAAFDAERTNRAVYVQALTEPVSGLSLTLGGRVEDNEKFGGFTTYRAGAAWRATETTRLRASVGTAFKEPTFYENFSTAYTRGNPELRPERSRSYEVGLEQKAGALTLGATAFAQRFRDMVQYTFQSPTQDGPNYFNVAGARADGVELTVETPLSRALSIQASYTWLDTEVTDAGFDEGPDAGFVEGDRLLRRPTYTATLGATVRPSERLRLGADVTHTGTREDLDFAGWPAKRVELDAYTRLDLSGEYRLLRAAGRRPDVALTARVRNALDSEYEEIVHFTVPGRTVLVGVKVGG